MKFHLPISLLVALMATFAAQADTEVTNSEPDPDNTISTSDFNWIPCFAEETLAVSTTQTLTSDASETDVSRDIAKYGEGTLSVNGEVSTRGRLYILEGALQIGSAEGERTTYTIISGGNENSGESNDGLPMSLGVAGKDAIVRIENADVSTQRDADDTRKWSNDVFVGGVNGNGTLIIDQGSVVDFSLSRRFVIGDLSDKEMSEPSGGFTNTLHNNIATDDTRSTPYQGTYTTVTEDGTTRTFGQGDVIVRGGSTLTTSKQSFWMADGSLTAEGTGTTVNITPFISNTETPYSEYCYRALMGLGQGANSEMVVRDGAHINIGAKIFVSNFSAGSTSNFIIDGEGSELNFTNSLGSISLGNTLNAFSVQDTTCTITLTHGGKLSFANIVKIGQGKENINTVKLTIDETSSMVFSSYYYQYSGVVTNNGTITGGRSFNAHGGKLENNGAITTASTINFSIVSATAHDGFEIINRGTMSSPSIKLGTNYTTEEAFGDPNQKHSVVNYGIIDGSITLQRACTLQSMGGSILKSVKITASNSERSYGSLGELLISPYEGQAVQCGALTVSVGSATIEEGGHLLLRDTTGKALTVTKAANESIYSRVINDGLLELRGNADIADNVTGSGTLQLDICRETNTGEALLTLGAAGLIADTQKVQVAVDVKDALSLIGKSYTFIQTGGDDDTLSTDTLSTDQVIAINTAHYTYDWEQGLLSYDGGKLGVAA
ncbi:MAG: hypothetical protein ACI4OS_07260, partial [Akkermansia sp.]